MKIVPKNNSLKLFSFMAQFLFAWNESGLDWQPLMNETTRTGRNHRSPVTQWAHWGFGGHLQFSTTVPFGPTWALQWRFPWRPGFCPAAWGRVSSLHPSAGTPGWCESAAPPGKCWHTQTPACPHRNSATTGNMTPTRFTPIFQTYLNIKIWHSVVLTTSELRMWIQGSEYDVYTLFYKFLSLSAEVNSTSTCHQLVTTIKNTQLVLYTIANCRVAIKWKTTTVCFISGD